jgi:hypothetical protein
MAAASNAQCLQGEAQQMHPDFMDFMLAEADRAVLLDAVALQQRMTRQLNLTLPFGLNGRRRRTRPHQPATTGNPHTCWCASC